MSWLTDLVFLTFGGDSVSGRVPPLVKVYGDLTPEQRGQVAHAYKQFCVDSTLALSNYRVMERDLIDGTRVRCVKIFDQDHVHVWPPQLPDKVQLPHGLLVVTNWHPPFIFKRTIDPHTGSIQWKIASDFVPQALKSIPAYNGVLNLTGETFMTLPMVRNQKSFWTYSRHGGHDFGSSAVPMPVNLYQTAHNVLSKRSSNWGVDDKIYGTDGSVLYAMPESANILVDGDTLHKISPNTDTRGGAAFLQTYRRAGIADTVVKYRFCNERLTTAEKDTYVLGTRNIWELVVTDVSNNAVTASLDSGVGVGEPISPTDLFAQHISVQAGYAFGYGHIIYTTTTDYLVIYDDVPFTEWGCVIVSDTPTGITNSKGGNYEYREEVAGPAVRTDLVIAPKEDGFDTIAWVSQVAYPSSVVWRGGGEDMQFSPSALYGSSFPPRYWVRNHLVKERHDAHYRRNVQPLVYVDVPWVPGGIKILEGSGAGESNGKKYIDTDQAQNNLEFYNHTNNMLCTGPVPPYFPQNLAEIPYPVGQTENWGQGTFAFAVASSAMSDVANAARVRYTGLHVEVSADEPLTNVIDCTYKSRHVIDFDSRSQFYAAIRVEVVATGATWAGKPLVVTANPTYTVKIYFESFWKGITAEQLLVTETVSRPMFEVEQLLRTNPFDYPGFDTGLIIYMPPRIAAPDDAASQLAALASNQGVNPHLAAQYVLADEPAHQSNHGIEYSEIHRAYETAPIKYCTGMLYARTFHLNDLSPALWLLSATKCNAPLNNIPGGAAYYYMPGILAALSTKFHIELRDGVLVNWSDEIPDLPGGPTRPALVDRDQISLYLV